MGRKGAGGGGVALGVDAAPATDAAATGAAVLDALAPEEELLPDSLESAVHDKIASIAIRLRVNTATNHMLTPHLVNFF